MPPLGTNPFVSRVGPAPSMYVSCCSGCYGYYACAIWMSVCIIVSAVWMTLELAW